MREIKFRAWDKATNEINNYVEIYCYKDGSTGFSASNENNNPIGNTENFIIMQYTGLKDKNGKEIYEGDFINCFNGTNYLTLIIEWNDSWLCFGANFYGELLYLNQLDEIEVIGNIYENTELCK